MPSSDAILSGLATIANEWQMLAIGWHAFFAVLAICVVTGWRPSNRLVASILVPPLVSVSILAWASSNPFNGAMFAILALSLGGVATRLSKRSVQATSPTYVVCGAVLLGFSWIYPHFLETDRWTTYLYAAPVGLIPCPTLSAAIGITLVLDFFNSRSWSLTLAIAGLVYGAIGAFRLGVSLDLFLLAGAVVLAGAVMRWTAHTAAGPTPPRGAETVPNSV